MRRIVLASTSRYRRSLLDRLGLDYEPTDPAVDEGPFKRRGLTPRMLVSTLAEAKARSVAAAYPDALIIGSDQCGEVAGEVLDKPGSESRAEEQLLRLVGRTHRLLTAVCVFDARASTLRMHVDEHRLTMRALNRAQIEAYVERDRPLDCAGSYKIESLGAILFERVEGEDPTAIVGLPLMGLARLLMDAGVDVLAKGVRTEPLRA